MVPTASWFRFKKWRAKRAATSLGEQQQQQEEEDEEEDENVPPTPSQPQRPNSMAKTKTKTKTKLQETTTKVDGQVARLASNEQRQLRDNEAQSASCDLPDKGVEAPNDSGRQSRSQGKLVRLIPRSLSNLIGRALSPSPSSSGSNIAQTTASVTTSTSTTTTTTEEKRRAHSPLRLIQKHLIRTTYHRAEQQQQQRQAVEKRQLEALETRTTNKQQAITPPTKQPGSERRQHSGSNQPGEKDEQERQPRQMDSLNQSTDNGLLGLCEQKRSTIVEGDAQALSSSQSANAAVEPLDNASANPNPNGSGLERLLNQPTCHNGRERTATSCHLTARTRDNLCALHGSKSQTELHDPVGAGISKEWPCCHDQVGGDSSKLAIRANDLVRPNGAAAMRRRAPKILAKSVPTWPLAKQTLDNNLAHELKLGHFGDCEDLLSSHLAGRLFGSLTAHQQQLEKQHFGQFEKLEPANCQGTGGSGHEIQNKDEDELRRLQAMFERTTNQLRLTDQLRAFNYNHKRPFGSPYESPTTGWLYNATGLQPINSGSTAMLAAKLFASSGFRRRSYDDQEGDNDFNIILQPSDIEDIERKAKTKYAQFKASTSSKRYPSPNAGATTTSLNTTTTINTISESSNPEATTTTIAPIRLSDATLANNVDNNQRANGRTQFAKSSTIISTRMKDTTIKTRKFNESSKLTALTNIFEDIKIAKCLLDHDYNQTVRLFIQKSALNWNFNSFTFDALCCGRSLTELLLHLFDYYNLYTIFNLDIIKVLKCFRLLEFGYHSTNPYHNSVHAADVTQAMHCFIQENKIRRHMTNLEILSSILAAVCHDLDHPGVNQSFLVATKNPLASLYRNTSVLENHHWRFALCIFKESQLFDHFERETLDDMKEQMKHLILATDIARQNEYLKRFKELTKSKQFSMANTNDRALVLQMALKCADLGNPCRPWMISRVWSNLICDEFYRMGRIERRLGIPLTPICQREKTSIAGIQTDFFRFIVLPLLELWHGFLSSPLSDILMSNFDHNYKRWQRANRIVQQLRRRKSIACLEPVEDNDENVYENYDGDKKDNKRESRKRQGRSGSLFVDPVIEDIYMKHSFKAVKRASSDYIKSGNGRLEVFRDFQLNRMIEKSPRVVRAYN